MTTKAATTPTPTRVQISALVTKPSIATPNFSNCPEQNPIPVFNELLNPMTLATAMLMMKAHINGLTGL
jgi:hypothetical protein